MAVGRQIGKRLQQCAGRLLRVLIYARYSTEEQDPSSIGDQFAFCRKHLEKLGICECQIVELSDAEISGELRNRPGIDVAWQGIASRSYDVIIAEDSSRLFRNPQACLNFVAEAVDGNIRVILPNDDIDTAKTADWFNELCDAQTHHVRTNSYTRKRIKRRHAALWEMGAAIGLLLPGYSRRPTTEVTKEDPEKGPFFDSIDEQWAPAIQEAFARVASGQPLFLVAHHLTKVALPKPTNSRSTKWSEKNVCALIRRELYRGVEIRRKTITRKIISTGKSRQERNEDPDELWTREMPHLRIVSDDLWYRANDAIDARIRKETPIGRDHPLTGIPRDSRGPLSGIFVCGVCGGKMYQEGRNKGGYRCKSAKSGACWNRATADRETAHKAIGAIIARELVAATGGIDAIVSAAEEQLRRGDNYDAKLRKLLASLDRNRAQQDRLLDLAEDGTLTGEGLRSRLQQRAEEGLRLEAALTALEERRKFAKVPSGQEINDRIQSLSAQLLSLDAEVGALLKQLLVGPIRAIPYQQFGGNGVFLRAEFTIRLFGILPDGLRLLLNQPADAGAVMHQPLQLIVDLFAPSGVPRNALRAYALRQELKLADVCRELEVGKRIGVQAIALGRRMIADNLDDPYVRLKHCPANASRWRAKCSETDVDDEAA